MPIDASIYSNVQAPQVNIPSPFDAAERGMKLSQLGMQQAQMQQQMATVNATRQAYAASTDPQTGELDRGRFLSTLHQAGPMGPMLAAEHAQQFVAQDKAKAEMQEKQAQAKGAQIDAAEKWNGVTFPAMNYLSGLPEDQRAAAYPGVLKQLTDQGVDISKMPGQYDAGHFRQTFETMKQHKPVLENFLTQAKIQEAMSNVATGPAKRNAELYGSRSPNAELTSQYDKQAAPIRSSQNAMQQMLDNYHHPSPQGDASLVLNAFKIKFPTAPDVNSLKELGESQSTIDKWKNAFYHASAGGLDKATRDNLMRDGVSTFRANVESLRGVQQRYNERAKFQNVNDPTMTAEPAIENTHAAAMDLQNKIGPYVPPTEREGWMGNVGKFVSKITGGGEQSATAAGEKPQQKYRASGSTLSADEVAQYATKHNLKLSEAQNLLKKGGYAIGR